jgi:Fic family protein
MSFDPSKPYNDLPDLPPSVDIETKTILKACVRARAALAALRQATALIRVLPVTMLDAGVRSLY